MNRIAKPGMVCRWANRHRAGTPEEQALIAAGMKLTAPLEMGARPWGATGNDGTYHEDTYLLRYAGTVANGRLLWANGYSAANDLFHPTAATGALFDSLRAQGIDPDTLTPEELTDLAFTATIAAGTGSGGGATGTPGQSPDNPWSRTSKPRDQADYEFCYFEGQTKPWQQNRWGEPGTFSPEWIEAGGIGPPVEPPDEPEEPPIDPEDPPVDPPDPPPPSDREAEIEDAVEAVRRVLDERWPR